MRNFLEHKLSNYRHQMRELIVGGNGENDPATPRLITVDSK